MLEPTASSATLSHSNLGAISITTCDVPDGRGYPASAYGNLIVASNLVLLEIIASFVITTSLDGAQAA
jgi:hypothetical protein